MGETAARKRLESLGYRIIAMNHRTRFGEIDIVARHRGQTVFVEVKTRRGRAFGLPEEQISAAKARRMIKAAQMFLAQANQRAADWRIDVVAIELSAAGEIERMEVIPNALVDRGR
ncbi:MAG: YraN family protein [Chloroflexi bacterium]|nr:YraN family protein [Chloroflexota bacterium]